jgi:hypothetical protein
MTSRISPLAAAGLLALGAVDVWLAAIIAGDIGADDQTASLSVQSTLKLPPPTDAAPSGKPIDAYGEILAHPIFYRTREPFVPPPPVPPKPVSPPPAPPAPVITDPGMVVAGIMIDRGIRKAYLFNKTDPRGSWVSQGETVNGWTLQAVDRTSIKLQQQTRIIELQLYPSPEQAGAATRGKQSQK